MSNSKWSHLHRPFGYEIANLLSDAELTFSDIKQELPHPNINDNEINRILTGKVDGEDVFVIPKTRGGKKYTLNRELFTENDLAKIHNRAQARIDDNLEQNDITDVKEENSVKHIDIGNMQSRFYQK